jgi:hypothetical protein
MNEEAKLIQFVEIAAGNRKNKKSVHFADPIAIFHTIPARSAPESFPNPLDLFQDTYIKQTAETLLNLLSTRVLSIEDMKKHCQSILTILHLRRGHPKEPKSKSPTPRRVPFYQARPRSAKIRRATPRGAADNANDWMFDKIKGVIKGVKEALYGKDAEEEGGIMDRPGYRAEDGEEAFMSGGLGEA